MARTDKGIIPLKPSLISSHLIAYYHTDATDWNQTKPVRDSALGWAVWPSGRLQTQVVSQRSASMSVASTRRSTFRPETWVSSKSTTRQSPLPRTSIFLDIPEHQAAASTRRQAQFTLCGNEVGLGLAPRNCRRITSLLQVGPAPRRFVRTWIVKQLFQVFSGQCQRGREIETNTLCKHWEAGKSPQNPWTESWIGRPRRKIGSAKIFRSWGRRGGQTLGKEKFWYCSLWDQSEVRIPTITTTTSESTGWSG